MGYDTHVGAYAVVKSSRQIDDLLPDRGDVFFSPRVDGLADDEFVIIGERGLPRGDMPSGDIIEIAGDDITRCVMDFAHTYSAEIAHLKEVTASIILKFGVITYKT